MEITILTTIVAHPCRKCGITFGMPDDYLDARRRDGKTFYCPNGHGLGFRETAEQKLQKRLDNVSRRLTATRELLDHEAASHRTTRGHLTRKRKQLARVTAGVCPCCNRSFANVARHMKTKHPDYVKGSRS